MSNLNDLYFDKTSQKILRQANKSFWVAVSSGITGLVFFVGVLGSIYLYNVEKDSSKLSESIDEARKDLSGLIEKIETENRTESEESESKARKKELENLNNKLDQISTDIEGKFTIFNTNYFIIVSLLAGGFLELIAIINFSQYGKAFAKISDISDRNQMFYLVNGIYDKFDDEQKKEAFPLIVNKIFPEFQFAKNDKFPSNNGDINGIKEDKNKAIIDKNKNN